MIAAVDIPTTKTKPRNVIQGSAGDTALFQGDIQLWAALPEAVEFLGFDNGSHGAPRVTILILCLVNVL